MRRSRRKAIILICHCLTTIVPSIAEVGDTVRFAVIGDFGKAGPEENAVADHVLRWNPDFIITTGDNNYDYGESATIDTNIGLYYHDYIFPYQGIFGVGADTNRFFPSMGNHDYACDDCPQPYLDYFSLPGNERYYNLKWGPVHLFALNSNSQEDDGIDSSSVQAEWLKTSLEASDRPFRIVYFHHPPYSSGYHGNSDFMQWPFRELGIDAVISGHEHSYERIMVGGLPYFVNGLGGREFRPFGEVPVEGSVLRFTDGYGAMLVRVTNDTAAFQFITSDGAIIDELKIESTGIPNRIYALGDSASVLQDSSVVINILLNDIHGTNGLPVLLAGLSQPQNGTSQIVSDSSIKYIPKANYVGYDSCMYFINNSLGAHDSATVLLNALPRNNALMVYLAELSHNVGLVPAQTALYPNYPNPFNSATSIRFHLALPSHVLLLIYDISGREIARLLDQYVVAGDQSIVWEGRSIAGDVVSSGIYFIRLATRSNILTKKMILLK